MLIGDDAPINVISQRLRDFHIENKVTYSFCAQLLQNLEEQPTDDIGVEWDSKKYIHSNKSQLWSSNRRIVGSQSSAFGG